MAAGLRKLPWAEKMWYVGLTVLWTAAIAVLRVEPPYARWLYGGAATAQGRKSVSKESGVSRVRRAKRSVIECALLHGGGVEFGVSIMS